MHPVISFVFQYIVLLLFYGSVVFIITLCADVCEICICLQVRATRAQ